MVTGRVACGALGRSQHGAELPGAVTSLVMCFVIWKLLSHHLLGLNYLPCLVMKNTVLNSVVLGSS